MNRHNAETRHFRMLTSIGYLLIALLVGGIITHGLANGETWRDWKPKTERLMNFEKR